jgi:hypothetical protein
MHDPLNYAHPAQEPAPHCELGALALAFTGIWLGCFTVALAALAALAVQRWLPVEQFTMLLAVFTLMAMAIFVPMGFMVAVLGLTERHRRQRYAYLCASINGFILTFVTLAVIWNRL